MVEEIRLKGMTWSDPRGYDSVAAASAAFAEIVPGVAIDWDKRSLQGFESTPVDELAAQYDLMIIDHPHVGEVVAKDCLTPIDRHAAPEDLARLESEAVGRSFASYDYKGHVWALPVDAATQVQAIRPDLGAVPHRRIAEVLETARDGRLIWPLRPPHSLMSYFTLAANMGAPCGVTLGGFTAGADGLKVIEVLQSAAEGLDPACFGMDPIAACDALAEGDRFTHLPMGYLYSLYGREGYRPHRLAFHDIPALGRSGPIGSALGGTGLAISARTRHPELCTRFAVWAAGAEMQSGLWPRAGGQPGNGRAWSDDAVNDLFGDAFANTRMTHEAAWLRPRHDGYMGFQEEGSHILNDILLGRTTPEAGLAALTSAFDASFGEET